MKRIIPVWRRKLTRPLIVLPSATDRFCFHAPPTGRGSGQRRRKLFGPVWITGSMHRRSARSFLQFLFLDRLLLQPDVYNLRLLYRMGAIHAAVQGDVPRGRAAKERAAKLLKSLERPDRLVRMR